MRGEGGQGPSGERLDLSASISSRAWRPVQGGAAAPGGLTDWQVATALRLAASTQPLLIASARVSKPFCLVCCVLAFVFFVFQLRMLRFSFCSVSPAILYG